jgi:hypothetical protein
MGRGLAMDTGATTIVSACFADGAQVISEQEEFSVQRHASPAQTI